MMSTPITDGSITVHVEGWVQDTGGSPIQNAKILLWGFILEAEATTDGMGHFELEASTNEPLCHLYAIYDDPKTPGIDLLPSSKAIKTETEVSERANFTLVPAATVRVIGQPRPIESSTVIQRYAFEVVVPSTGRPLRFDDYSLTYGTGMNVQSYFLGLDPSTVIVPAGVSFAVSVSSSYQYERTRSTRRWYGWRRSRERVDAFTRFEMVEGDGFNLGAKEVLDIDIRGYSLLADLEKVETLRSEAEANVTSMEAKGFYTTSERHTLRRTEELVESSVTKLEIKAYDDSYVDLRQAYLNLKGVKARLETLAGEASFSVNILVAFVALTTVASAALLTERNALRVVLSGAFSSLLLLYLYNVYPGSGFVSVDQFLRVSLASILAVVLGLISLPWLLTVIGGGGVFPGLGGLVAVFSMAKRNLKRRRMRSLFTFSTLLALTMSFVALTSLSTGYGLIYTRAYGGKPEARGIMARMPEYKPEDQFEEGWFYPIVETIEDWVLGNEGVATVALKAENTPSLRPYASLDGWSIFGIVGVQPSVEPLMGSIDGVVAVGEPLRERGTCLLHVLLQHQGGIDEGDQISIRGVDLTVVGFFDSGIRGVTDLDGGTILPSYQVNLTPGDEPTIVAMECETWEVVVTTLETALMMDRVLVSRIDALLKEGVDAEALGKSMALSREYRFWVSEGGAVYLAYMGGLIGGKGLPLVVPWAIVVLNVVATMLSSMFERRREIDILSGIGLNPAHIAGVFLAEASIMGVIAGGLGYMLGLGWYPLMAGLSMAPVVQQKVSAVWCVAAIGISMASVIVGSAVALRSSVVLTPSLRRRWALGEGPVGLESGWGVQMPLRLEEGEVNSFVEYVVGYLGFYDDRDRSPYLWSVRQGFEEGEGGPIWTVTFNFSEAGSSLKSLFATNRMTVSRDPRGGVYSVGLECIGDQDSAYKTGTFVRRMILDWTAGRRGGGGMAA